MAMMQHATVAVLWISLLAAFYPRSVPLAWVLAAVALVLGMVSGLIEAMGLALLLVMAFSAFVARRDGPFALRAACHVVVTGFVAAAFLHVLPGVGAIHHYGPVVLSTEAVPYTLRWTLDKPAAGLVLLAAGLVGVTTPNLREMLSALPLMVVTTVVALGAGLVLGLFHFEPRLHSGAGLWALQNLLGVCIAEEAFFRGYLQRSLQGLLEARRPGSSVARWGAPVAVGVLFGVLHFGGGWQWMFVAAAAGIGYGLVYQRAGLAAAVCAHFLLNATHFLLLTYPFI